MFHVMQKTICCGERTELNPDCCLTQKMCEKVVSEEPFMLKYHPDKCKTQ